MADVVGIGELTTSMIREALAKVERREITHGIFCYREIDGSLKYACFGEEYTTYLIGMMARAAIHLHSENNK